MDMTFEEYKDYFRHHKADNMWKFLRYSTVDALTILE
jgi:uncharacterized C2H2 Zn-finger protein